MADKFPRRARAISLQPSLRQRKLLVPRRQRAETDSGFLSYLQVTTQIGGKKAGMNKQPEGKSG